MSPRHCLISLLLGALLTPGVALAQDTSPELPLWSVVTVPSTTQAPVAVGLADKAYVHAAELRNRISSLPSGSVPSRILKLGDQGEDVSWLAQALSSHGYLQLNSADPLPATSIFDDQLELALKSFQKENGLNEDGVAGNQVYTTLTADPTRLAVGLESWGASVKAWSDELRAAGYKRAIIVNLASYTLHAINLETDEVELESRVIVGSPRTKTPRMMTRIVNLKANPDWTPPASIRGARYQRPGPNNALGLMRFSTDNNMSIYLHDTNARGLFSRDSRALSHGCVRVQQWHDLSSWTAQEDSSWVDNVALAGGKTRFLKVDPVPVLLVYSRVDIVDGKPRSFPDVYGLGDAGIANAALEGRSESGVKLFNVAPASPSILPVDQQKD